MRFIPFTIIFLILALVATFFVSPLYRNFIEGKLKEDVTKALEDSVVYKNVEVHMNHLHADKVILTRRNTGKNSVESVKKDVTRIIREVAGAHTEEKYIDPELIGKPPVKPKRVQKDEPKIASVKVPDPSKTSVANVAIAPDANTPNIAKVVPAKQAPVVKLDSSSINIEWNDRKTDIKVDGKLASKKVKEEFVTTLEKTFGAAVSGEKIVYSKEKVAKQVKLRELVNLAPEIMNGTYGSGYIRAVEKPGKLEIKGALHNKATYEELKSKLDMITADKIALKDSMKYLPEFSVEKDDEARTVTLKGYADKHDCVDLSSYIKRYTKEEANGYTFVPQIAQDPKSEEYLWTSSDQSFLDIYLENTVRGKITYAKDSITEVTGVTNNLEYYNSLKNQLSTKNTKFAVTYDENAKSITPKKIVKKSTDTEEKAKMAKNNVSQVLLRSQLKDYKVYFASGQKTIDPKYDELIQGIANVIKASADKKSIIVIGGFSDHTGNPEKNEQLSKERAGSVQRRLVSHGVTINRTVVEFFGAEKATENKSLSRRVEIRVR